VKHYICNWRVFIIHLLNIVKPVWCSNSSKLCIVMSTCRSTCPVCVSGLCMSIHSERISKDKVVVITLNKIPDVCSTSNADKSF